MPTLMNEAERDKAAYALAKECLLRQGRAGITPELLESIRIQSHAQAPSRRFTNAF
jgi:hypothetical protein